MIGDELPFVFDLDATSLDQTHDFIAFIPADLHESKSLFHALSEALSFPSYFGNNWDALADCLSDFSWIDKRNIIIVHEDMPSLVHDQLSIYLETLEDCVNDWKTDEIHRVVIGFPASCKEKIEQIILQR